MKRHYLALWVLALLLGVGLGLTLAPAPATANGIRGARMALPILNQVGDTFVLDGPTGGMIQVQNVGGDFSKAIMFLWGPSSQACEPQAPGPLKVECSGLLKPGTAWIWKDSLLPSTARSALIYSVRADWADFFCSLAQTRLSHFGWKSWVDTWASTEGAVGSGLAVDVARTGPGDLTATVGVTSSYSGIGDDLVGTFDPVFGGFAFYAPLVFGDMAGFNSFLHIQNIGTDCTSVEIWFKAQDDCLRATIGDVLALAPGETATVDPLQFVQSGFQGSVWIRTSQPVATVIDHVGRDVLMSYNGVPAHVFLGDQQVPTPSQVNYGPLIFREFQGWETGIQVQNLSAIFFANVKVYFMDASGGIITTLVDWICPRGSQTFFLPVINNLPGNYVGSVRVESQATVVNQQNAPPIQSVANLVKYEGPAKSIILDAISYNLLGEPDAFDWQAGDRVDVVFAHNLSESMAGTTARAVSLEVIDRVRDRVRDSAFGAGSFTDYDRNLLQGPNTCDTVQTPPDYGITGDYPWRTDALVTLDRSFVRGVIQGYTTAVGAGGDTPQSYTRALFETQNFNWRSMAEKVVVIYGDAPTHDCLVFLPLQFGGDPGRDLTFGTADDLNLLVVVNQLKASNVHVVYVDYSFGKPFPLQAAGMARFIAEQTGGLYVQAVGRTADDVAEDISTFIKAVASPDAPDGPGDLLAVPSLLKQHRGVSTDIAIQNINPNPGFTDFVIYIYDQNGLIDFICQKLNEKQVEYINLDTWGYINPGFLGSAVISVTYTSQPGGPGLAGVVVERLQGQLFDLPGDQSKGHEMFPIRGPFHFQGPTPNCPGQPTNP